MSRSIRTLLGTDIPNDVFAELVQMMYQSRIAVRWTVASILPLTVYAMFERPLPSIIAIAAVTFLVCLARIVVTEGYSRRDRRSECRWKQNRWQRRYAIAALAYSGCVSAFAIAAILMLETWTAAWTIGTVVAYSYGLVGYVAMRPAIAYVQSSMPMIATAAALLQLPGYQPPILAFALLVGTVSVWTNVKKHYAASLDLILARKAVERSATTDDLTGLWNRRHLDACLAAVTAEEDADVCYLSVDLDRFKAVNDTFGHSAGDEVLRIVGRRLLSTCGNDAFVARAGGDEFGVVLAGSIERAENLAQLIIEQLSLPMWEMRQKVSIGASVGCTALWPGDTVDGICRRADDALYAAKNAGRGTVHIATPELAA